MKEIKLASLTLKEAVNFVCELESIKGIVGNDLFGKDHPLLNMFCANIKDQILRVVEESDSVDKGVAMRKFAEHLSKGVRVQIPEQLQISDELVIRKAFGQMIKQAVDSLHELKL